MNELQAQTTEIIKALAELDKGNAILAGELAGIAVILIAILWGVIVIAIRLRKMDR